MVNRYVTDLVLLGVLVSQVWHWYTWTKGERNFIRVIVVSLGSQWPHISASLSVTHNLRVVVLGPVLVYILKYLRYALVRLPVGRSLRYIFPIRR